MKKSILISCLSVLFLSMTCDEESFNDMIGVTVSAIDNSGAEFAAVSDGKCPKEALILRITPEWNPAGYNSGKLLSPIVALRIVTLTDFDDSHPAGSDVSVYFNTYPKELDAEMYNSVYDTLEDGIPISCWQEGESCYKALTTVPAPGDYIFRVELEMEDGTLFTCNTESINLY